MKLFGHKSRSQPLSETPPRNHHYTFAHKLLPAAFFNDPVKFMTAFREEGSVYLWFCWDRVGKTLDQGERLSRGALDFRLVDLGSKTTALVIALPTPKGMTEAHYVALVHQPAQPPSTAELTRVIALEHSADENERPMTCLCEWAGEMHMNLGAGPEPTLDKFVDAVKAVLAR